MPDFDRNYLRNDQYRTAAHLTSRIDLHMSFSANHYGWFRWVFDQFELSPRARILEIACGRGDLWHENLRRIPSGWEITLTDFSEGMLAEARARLAGAPHTFQFDQVDIQHIPFDDAAFDAVIANYMLYYVKDKKGAFTEVLRVLRPHGQFFATTIGERHMGELTAILRPFCPQGFKSLFDSRNLDFLLENGAAQLGPFFDDVHMRRYEDSLFVTQAEPLIQYVYSGTLRDSLKDAESQLRDFIVRKIQENGGIYIFKDSGIFIARKGGRHASTTSIDPVPIVPPGLC